MTKQQWAQQPDNGHRITADMCVDAMEQWQAALACAVRDQRVFEWRFDDRSEAS